MSGNNVLLYGNDAIEWIIEKMFNHMHDLKIMAFYVNINIHGFLMYWSIHATLKTTNN